MAIGAHHAAAAATGDIRQPADLFFPALGLGIVCLCKLFPRIFPFGTSPGWPVPRPKQKGKPDMIFSPQDRDIEKSLEPYDSRDFSIHLVRVRGVEPPAS